MRNDLDLDLFLTF